MKVGTVTGDERRIIPKGERVRLGRFTLLPIGLVVDEKASEAEWTRLFQQIRTVGASLQWVLGDWLAYGEQRWGKTYEQMAAVTGFKVSTLYDYAYVARSVQISMRIETLSFNHHQVVAPLPPKEQTHWLNLALVNKWSVAELRAELFPSGLEARPPLADRETRQVFNEVCRQLSRGEQPRREAVDQLKDWIEQVEALLADQ